MSSGQRFLSSVAGPVAKRFWAKVNKDGPVVRPELGPCWLWTGALNRDGYGHVRIEGQLLGAHQVAVVLAGGTLIAELEVCHHCDVRNCVRGSHLFQGTHLANVRDMHAKGRARKATGDANGSRLHPESRPRGDMNPARLHPERMPRGDRNGARTKPETRARGERNGSSRLTQAQVDAIRARFTGRRGEIIAMAREMNVSKTAVRNVLLGRTWRAA